MPDTLPIDVWFAEQDRSVDAELKVIKRNKRRRKFDYDEMERRIKAKMAAEQEQLAIEVAIARAIYRTWGHYTVAETDRYLKPELLEALQRRMPGKTFNDYVVETRAASTEPRKYWGDGTRSEHYWQVREEIVRQMDDEAEARQKEREAATATKRLLSTPTVDKAAPRSRRRQL